jgi:16S rRNA (guanine527-N7)-methyltransferase
LDYDTFVARDVVDSLQLADCLEAGEKVLDVGSGGGVPGMLVAILRPDVSMTLSDSIAKKTNALSNMVAELNLPIKVLTSRVQDMFPKQRFDTLIARAVGPMVKILRWIEPHWKSFDRVLLIKGPRWIEERKEARHQSMMTSIELRVLKKYPMPGTESESVVLSFQKNAP